MDSPLPAVVFNVINNYIAANKRNLAEATTEAQSKTWADKLDTCYQILDSLKYEVYPPERDFHVDDEDLALVLAGVPDVETCKSFIRELISEREVRDARKHSGELWIDEEGNANFKFHIEGGSFSEAREALTKFISVLQERLARETDCPYYEPTVK